MKSLEFFKPTLATTLAIVLASLLSVRPAQAGYTVTLRQVGLNVVATGRGSIDLTGLTFFQSTSLDPAIHPFNTFPGCPTCGKSTFIYTGPTSSRVDSYSNPGGGDLGFRGLVVGYRACQQWQRQHGRDSHKRRRRGIPRKLTQCSKGLCLGYCPIGQRDLQGRDSCKTWPKTGHLRLEVGNRSEPELHAANPVGSRNHQLLGPRIGPNRPRGYYRQIHHRRRLGRGPGARTDPCPTPIQCLRSAGRPVP